MLMGRSSSSEHPTLSPFSAASSRSEGLENSCREQNPRVWSQCDPQIQSSGELSQPHGGRRCPQGCPLSQARPRLPAAPRKSQAGRIRSRRCPVSAASSPRVPMSPRRRGEPRGWRSPRVPRALGSEAPWGWLSGSRRSLGDVRGCRRQEGTGRSPCWPPGPGWWQPGMVAPPGSWRRWLPVIPSWKRGKRGAGRDPLRVLVGTRTSRGVTALLPPPKMSPSGWASLRAGLLFPRGVLGVHSSLFLLCLSPSFHFLWIIVITGSIVVVIIISIVIVVTINNFIAVVISNNNTVTAANIGSSVILLVIFQLLNSC